MTKEFDFILELEVKIREQLRSQRVGYLLGAGSSYLDGTGYPLSSDLWSHIRDLIKNTSTRDDIQKKLDSGANGIEQALDLLDDGGAIDTPYRHHVTEAISELFRPMKPNINYHIEFVRHLSQRGDPDVKVFTLNYDPLIERAAETANIRITDGFFGIEEAFFDLAVFEERIGRIRGTFKNRQFTETIKPIHLYKLHGSLGWYQCPQKGVRRCGYSSKVPNGTKLLMIPPQRRKANDTMLPPYAILWSAFRGSLNHSENPLNRLACFGYGFGDEHVNAVIEAAIPQPNFSLLIFSRSLSDAAWNRWSTRPNIIVVTESRCSLKGNIGPGHPTFWQFERLCGEV